MCKHDISRGRLSGFPFCCIIVFLVRSFFFHNSTKFAKYCQKEVYRGNQKVCHITCLFHTILYKFKDPVYYKCLDCKPEVGWKQLNEKTCNLCGNRIKRMKNV